MIKPTVGEKKCIYHQRETLIAGIFRGNLISHFRSDTRISQHILATEQSLKASRKEEQKVWKLFSEGPTNMEEFSETAKIRLRFNKWEGWDENLIAA